MKAFLQVKLIQNYAIYYRLCSKKVIKFRSLRLGCLTTAKSIVVMVVEMEVA